jgi:hypothetical protein
MPQYEGAETALHKNISNTVSSDENMRSLIWEPKTLFTVGIRSSGIFPLCEETFEDTNLLSQPSKVLSSMAFLAKWEMIKISYALRSKLFQKEILLVFVLYLSIYKSVRASITS